MAAHLPFEITEYGNEGFRPVVVRVIKEIPLHIFVGGHELVSLLCSGLQPRSLAVGFLFSCGLIATAGDIAVLEVEGTDSRIEVRVELRDGPPDICDWSLQVTSGLGRLVQARRARAGKVLPLGGPRVHPDDVLSLMRELHDRSDLYRLTKGCHNAALCTAKEMLVFRSDIGRHNAVDAIVGHCLLEGVSTDDKLLLTTGRAASEIVSKAANAGVRVLAASAAATSLATQSARQQALTLLGCVTRESFRIYSAPERILTFGRHHSR